MNGSKAKRMRRHWLGREPGERKYAWRSNGHGRRARIERDDGYTRYRQKKRLVSSGAPQYSKTDPGETRRKYRVRRAQRAAQKAWQRLKEAAADVVVEG